MKLQTHYSQNLLFILFMVICLHFIKQVALGFNTFVALPVPACILRALLWKVLMEYKFVMLLTIAPFRNFHHLLISQSTQFFQW